MFKALWQLPFLKKYTIRYNNETDTTEILCPNIRKAIHAQADICPYIYLIKSKRISFISTNPANPRNISLEVSELEQMYQLYLNLYGKPKKSKLK